MIEELNADIYVIQECENPKKFPELLKFSSGNCFWCGEKDSKGLAIFAKPSINMELNDWPTYCLRHFMSVRIDNLFNLVGVWAAPPYIEEYYIYQAINISKYDSNTLLIGDFNSNAIWDKSHGKRSHSKVVEELKEKNIVSAYHYSTGENEGEETKCTFHLYRHTDKQYHIDYCFLCPNLLKNFEILDSKSWLQYSDHFPIQVEI